MSGLSIDAEGRRFILLIVRRGRPGAIRQAAGRGRISIVSVDSDGVIDLDALASALSPDTSVVSVMLANNEVGTIQPFDRVAQGSRDGAEDPRRAGVWACDEKLSALPLEIKPAK